MNKVYFDKAPNENVLTNNVLPSNELPETADVVVIGLGTIGSMALWQAAELVGGDSHGKHQRDIRVVGIEQFTRIHTLGSYSGESRLFRVALKEGSRYIRLALEAREMWIDLNARSGHDVFLPIGALSVANENFASISSTKAVLEEFNLPHTMLTANQLRAEFPQFAVVDGDVGVLDHLGGGIRPELAVATAQQEALKAGATIVDDCAVTALDYAPESYEKSGTITIETAKGTITAQKVIVTTGSWAAELVTEIADLIQVHKLPLTWLMPLEIDPFLPSKLPIFLRDLTLADGTNFHVYGAPSLDGYSVKVSTEMPNSQVASVREIDADMDEAFKKKVGRQVAEVFPALVPYPVRATMHHDGFTSDESPIIDTSLPGLTLAVGMSGRGMKFAPIYGRLAAELAINGSSDKYNPEFSISAHELIRE